MTAELTAEGIAHNLILDAIGTTYSSPKQMMDGLEHTIATAIKEAEARGLERAANLIEDSWPFEKRLSDLIAEIRSLKPSPENPKG